MVVVVTARTDELDHPTFDVAEALVRVPLPAGAAVRAGDFRSVVAVWMTMTLIAVVMLMAVAMASVRVAAHALISPLTR